MTTVAQAWSLAGGTVCRHADSFARLELKQYLTREQRGYWGQLTSQPLAGPRVGQALYYTNGRALRAWVVQTYGVRHSISGLTDLLHRLGFCYKLAAR